jgi:ligand-binding sensor domain-containing protein
VDRDVPKWKRHVASLGLIGIIVSGLVYIYRPERVAPLPSGWTLWEQPGATSGIAMTPEGIFAGGTRGLVMLHEGRTATSVKLPGTNGSLLINAILLDRKGVLWVGHNQGVSIRAASGWETLAEADGLPHRNVSAIATTRAGDVWLGTLKGAVKMPFGGPWNRGTMQRLAKSDGLLSDSVSAIIEDDEGGLWFGNSSAPAGGLSRLKDGQWSHWTPKEGLAHPNVTSLMVAGNGRLWAGCGQLHRGSASLFSRASGRWEIERTVPTEELAGPNVRSLFEDHHGRIWMGSEYDGLTIRKENDTIMKLTPDRGFPIREVMAVVETRDGSIWLGTQIGVIRITAGAVGSLFSNESNLGKGARP